MRQRVRRTMILVSFLLFPIIMNYLSPYVSISGAAAGYVTISLVMFAALFVSSLVLGRLWCGWLCPAAGLNEACLRINDRPVNRKLLRRFRLGIFTAWFATLLVVLALAGGFQKVVLWYLTENGISVDMPIKYMIYYLVVGLFLVLNLTLGRRGSCHAICWMAPFMTAGYHVGKLVHLPQLRVRTTPSSCISCGRCDRTCPMSLPVQTLVKTGKIQSSDCILCGECIDGCPRQVLRMGFKDKNPADSTGRTRD
jgi:ferredoxin-type protein NapH